MAIKLRNMATLYIRQNGKFLLLYRVGSRVVPPSWCGIGGHFEENELNEPIAAMLREAEEEIDLKPDDFTNIALRYVTFRLKNGEIRQNYYYFADLRANVPLTMECNEGKLDWFAQSALPYDAMPHTAQYVMQHYMETGVGNDILYAGTTVENGVQFHAMVEF